jgi:hypothetical protein
MEYISIVKITITQSLYVKNIKNAHNQKKKPAGDLSLATSSI